MGVSGCRTAFLIEQKYQMLKAVTHSDGPVKSSTVADQVSPSVQHTKRLLDDLEESDAVVEKIV